MHFMSRLLVVFVLLSTALISSRKSGAAESVSRPNILVIMADDMGFGDVNALNSASKIPTPNLDRLAGESMAFTDAHSPSAVCTPTRYALITGRYCWRTKLTRGVLGGYSPPLIDEDRSTIATLLHENGYSTHGVGKWHLGMELPMLKGKSTDGKKWDGDPGVDFKGTITDSPIHHGFDSYFGVSASLDMAPYVYIRDDHFNQVPTLQQKRVGFPHFVRQGPRSEEFVIDEVLDRLTTEAVKIVKDHANNEKPFFLYLPLTAPHKPTQPHERFRGKTGLNEYGDFVAQVDWTVGQVLNALDETGITDNTVVFFTSDNGSYMYRYDDPNKKDHVDDATIQGYRAEHHRPNGPFRGTKADVWEAGHHLPFFVRWPGQVEPGSQCDETICHTDIYATCAAIVGAKLDNTQAEDSCSLLPLLRQEPGAKRGAHVINHSANGMFAIRDGKWKLVLGNGSGGREKPRGKPFERPYQLFDLSKDIGETTNVIEDHPEIAKRLEKIVEEYRSSGRSVER
jgi:arylsulfatase A-like enzyme